MIATPFSTKIIIQLLRVVHSRHWASHPCDASWEGVAAVVAGDEGQGLNKNRHQGYYGEIFVASIAAAAGYDVLIPYMGDDFDIQVTGRGPKGTSNGRQIGFQIKSWSMGVLNLDGYFHYPLKVDAYNFLARKNDVRHYLALCIVPKEIDDYTDARYRRLVHKYATYWLSLLGKEQVDEPVSADSTRTVYVPARNLITPTTMRALLENRENQAVVR